MKCPKCLNGVIRVSKDKKRMKCGKCGLDVPNDKDTYDGLWEIYKDKHPKKICKECDKNGIKECEHVYPKGDEETEEYEVMMQLDKVDFTSFENNEDETYTLKREYFTKGNLTLADFTKGVERAVIGSNVISGGTERRDWPDKSYMWVIFEMEEVQTCNKCSELSKEKDLHKVEDIYLCDLCYANSQEVEEMPPEPKPPEEPEQPEEDLEDEYDEELDIADEEWDEREAEFEEDDDDF